MLNRISNSIWDFMIALVSVGLFTLSHVMFILVDYKVIISNLSFIKGTGFLFIAYITISLIGIFTIEPVSEAFSCLVHKITLKEIETVNITDFLVFSGLYFIVPFVIFLIMRFF